MPNAQQGSALPFRTKVLHGIGSMSDGAQLQLVGGVLLLYYSQVLRLPAQWVSLALAISIFLDAFWDPWIGYASDNLRTRLGRRHPLMYASALPAAACFAMLWLPPAGLSDFQLFAWLLACVASFRFFHSCYMVPSGALAPELAPAYHDRTVLIGYRWMLGAAGGAITAILVYGVFLRGTPEFPQGQLNPAGYPGMALAIAAFIAATILIASFGTHSQIASLHRPAPSAQGLRASLQEVLTTFKNRNFIVAVIAGALGATSSALYQGLTIYFNTYLFALPSSSLMALVLTLLVSGPLAFVVAPTLSRRLGKKRACMGLFFTSLLFTHGPIILRLLDLLPANGTPQLLGFLLVNNLIGGVLSMSGFILATSMIADIVEDNQVRTGRRSEGLLFSADSLLNKIVSAMATILPGLLLALVQFPVGARAETLDPAILRHLAMIYVPVAVTLSAFSIASWSFYRIDEGAHAANLKSIEMPQAAPDAPAPPLSPSVAAAHAAGPIPGVSGF